MYALYGLSSFGVACNPDMQAQQTASSLHGGLFVRFVRYVVLQNEKGCYPDAIYENAGHEEDYCLAAVAHESSLTAFRRSAESYKGCCLPSSFSLLVLQAYESIILEVTVFTLSLLP